MIWRFLYFLCFHRHDWGLPFRGPDNALWVICHECAREKRMRYDEPPARVTFLGQRMNHSQVPAWNIPPSAPPPNQKPEVIHGPFN